MPKNTKGGNRHKKMASKNAKPSYSLKMRYKNEEEECEMYAKVLQVFGGGMVQVLCDDKVERLCVMRRKFKGRNKRDNQIKINGILLVGKREWEVVHKQSKEKVDLLYVYNDVEIEKLKNDKLKDIGMFITDMGDDEVLFDNTGDIKLSSSKKVSSSKKKENEKITGKEGSSGGINWDDI